MSRGQQPQQAQTVGAAPAALEWEGCASVLAVVGKRLVCAEALLVVVGVVGVVSVGVVGVVGVGVGVGVGVVVVVVVGVVGVGVGVVSVVV